MNSFEDNYDFFMKSIDKSKNKLELITDKNGNVRRVWKHIETGESKEAGKNAGKAYERSGKRHTSHSGFESGETVLLSANGGTIKGIFRHVNESKHSTVAVIRGEDGKLYERGIKKISKYEEPKKEQHKFVLSAEGLTKEQITAAKKQYNDVLNDLTDKLNASPSGFAGLVDFSKMSDSEAKAHRENDAQYNKIHKQFRNFNGSIPKKIANEMALEARQAKIKYKTKEEFEAVNKQSSENISPKVKSERKSEALIEPLRNKKKIGIGDNESVSFLDKSKQAWNKGDSVTFESKNGQQKVGRVLKVDDNINMTTIRLANGLVETVSNKKILQ